MRASIDKATNQKFEEMDSKISHAESNYNTYEHKENAGKAWYDGVVHYYANIKKPGLTRFLASILTILILVPTLGWAQCPATGDSKNAKLQALDLQKNRSIKPLMPPRQMDVTQFMTGKPDELSFSSDNYVSVTGVIAMVKYGRSESCNCHSDDRTTYDYHIELADSAGKSQIMICEVSRFTKDSVGVSLKDSTGLGIGAIKALIGKKVTIEGYLFYDEEHWQNAYNSNPKGTNVWRGTCWEVHPVFKITPLN